MRSFHVLDVKKFMSVFLLQQDFDAFLLQEMEIYTAYRTKISGRRNRKWYSNEELMEFADAGCKEFFYWKDMREQIKNHIKGKRTPELLTGIFRLQDKESKKLIMEAGMKEDTEASMIWNLRYEKEELYLVTALSVELFTLDKSLAQIWDSYMEDFLRKLEICYE